MERTIEVAERAGIHSKESMEYAKQAMQFAQNAAEVAGKAIDAARTLTVRFDEMLNAKEKPKELE